jgi:hypothetical protein
MKLTVVLDYHEAMETYSRLGIFKTEMYYFAQNHCTDRRNRRIRF